MTDWPSCWPRVAIVATCGGADGACAPGEIGSTGVMLSSGMEGFPLAAGEKMTPAGLYSINRVARERVDCSCDCPGFYCPDGVSAAAKASSTVEWVNWKPAVVRREGNARSLAS